MTKARENSDYTGLAADIVAGDTAARAGRKNLIINGGFDVWQRGTSFSAGNEYIADRWYSDSVACIATRELLTETNQYGAKFSLASTSIITGQRIEDVSRLSGKTLTLSYKVKTTSPVGIFRVYGYYYNTAGTLITSGLIEGNISIDTTLTKKSVTFTVPDLSASSIKGSGSFMYLRFDDGTVTASDFTLSEVQLELGSVATDFEHRSYGEELALCQRYYETGSSNHYGSSDSGSNIVAQGDFAVVKRATPTMVYGTWSYSSVSTTGTGSPTNYQTDSRHWRCFMNVATARNSAYLSGSWAAEAEL
jgi:hypothetical protein